MTQIFGIHSINGLPNNPNNFTKGSYNIPSLDYLPNYFTNNLSSLYIASDPAGAQIFIDDIEQTGLYTPAMINDLPSGYHNIKLSSSGYIDIESSMPLESGRTYNVFLTMEKESQEPTCSCGIIIGLGLLALGLGLMLIGKK